MSEQGSNPSSIARSNTFLNFTQTRSRCDSSSYLRRYVMQLRKLSAGMSKILDKIEYGTFESFNVLMNWYSTDCSPAFSRTSSIVFGLIRRLTIFFFSSDIGFSFWGKGGGLLHHGIIKSSQVNHLRFVLVVHLLHLLRFVQVAVQLQAQLA